MIGVHLPELKIEFDISKVTFVQELHDELKVIFLDVHFVGGESLSLPGWNLQRWLDLKNKLNFQMSVNQKQGGLKV